MISFVKRGAQPKLRQSKSSNCNGEYLRLQPGRMAVRRVITPVYNVTKRLEAATKEC